MFSSRSRSSLKQKIYRSGIFAHTETQIAFWPGLCFEHSPHHVCCRNQVLAVALQRLGPLTCIGPRDEEFVIRSIEAHSVDARGRLRNDPDELARLSCCHELSDGTQGRFLATARIQQAVVLLWISRIVPIVPQIVPNAQREAQIPHGKNLTDGEVCLPISTSVAVSVLCRISG